MIPTVVLVGRPNVGKSTLFNRLTKSQDALVGPLAGLTRDRHYGRGRLGDKPFLVIDTGGFEPTAKQGIFVEMAKQTMQAVIEADVILFLVDARQGLVSQDEEIARRMRKMHKKVILVVNKAEGLQESLATAEFQHLGFAETVAISSSHGEGVRDLIDIALRPFDVKQQQPQADKRHPTIAVVGRPNVGKSTLINALLGEERVVVFDEPGTTRDSIHIDFERGEKRYTLIDTAGIRKRGKVFEAIEKFSVIKTLQSVEEAQVVMLVLDATDEEVTEQDAHIAGFILDAGRALVVLINKWDAANAYMRDLVKRSMTRKLNFLQFARVHYISALKQEGIARLFLSVDAAYRAAMVKLPTPKLTRALQEAVTQQPPPRKGPIRPKLRYAHQGGSNPPIVVIHGNALNKVPRSYTRYLENMFREKFKLHGTPLRVQYKSSNNPYAEK